MENVKTLEQQLPREGERSARQKRDKPVYIGRIIIYALLIVYTLWLLAPFAIIIVTSLTSSTEYLSATSYIWWPDNISLEGYLRLFREDPFMVDGIPSILRGFINTMWITLVPLCSSLLQSLLVAYCYSKYNFPCRNFLFMFTVTLMFIPLGAFGFVSYMFYQSIGFINIFMQSGRSTPMLKIPYAFVYGIAPVSYILMLVSYFYALIKGVKSEAKEALEV